MIFDRRDALPSNCDELLALFLFSDPSSISHISRKGYCLEYCSNCHSMVSMVGREEQDFQ